MMKNRRLFFSLAVIATLFLAAAFTVATMAFQRFGPETVIRGNVCGPDENAFCYVPLLKGGFPLAFVTDSQATSVWDQLGAEDDFHLVPFLIDTLFFSAVIWGSLGIAHFLRARMPRSA